MTLSLPGKTPDPEIPDSRLDRTLSDLEDFCKHMRMMGQTGGLTILIADADGNTSGIVGFNTMLGFIKIGKAL